jgi:predicted aspartyl protease
MFMTDISIDGHRVTVRLDSGADDELILRDSAWAQIVPSTARTTTSLGVGAAGFFVKPLVRLADVKIGGESIGDAIATQIASATSTGNSDGILGMGILSHFSFFLNPQTGVLVISRPQKPQPPRLETMAGILGPPTDEGITVMHVMAKSPAEAAGIKEGDRFCTVDGETVHASWHDDPKHAWMTGPDGKTVVLGRCGGGEVKVTLRRFY